ncbi:hypothetical protein B0H11DRAFT_1904108 [Mycena galericulata]|nr:hypothetical protein B0H11DRAFT_1904108 [Mycena galericulata]
MWHASRKVPAAAFEIRRIGDLMRACEELLEVLRDLSAAGALLRTRRSCRTISWAGMTLCRFRPGGGWYKLAEGGARGGVEARTAGKELRMTWAVLDGDGEVVQSAPGGVDEGNETGRWMRTRATKMGVENSARVTMGETKDVKGLWCERLRLGLVDVGVGIGVGWGVGWGWYSALVTGEEEREREDEGGRAPARGGGARARGDTALEAGQTFGLRVTGAEVEVGEARERAAACALHRKEKRLYDVHRGSVRGDTLVSLEWGEEERERGTPDTSTCTIPSCSALSSSSPHAQLASCVSIGGGGKSR